MDQEAKYWKDKWQELVRENEFLRRLISKKTEKKKK